MLRSKNNIMSRALRFISIVLVLALTTSILNPVLGSGDGLVPTAPQSLSGTPANGQVSLSWDEPAYSNASVVSEYRIYRGLTEGNQTLLVTLSVVATFINKGLVNGQTYYYSISAVNSAGEGNRSESIAVTPRTVPNRPLEPAAIPGNLFLNVTWQTPDFNGGAPILGYVVYRLISNVYEEIANVTNATYYIDSQLVIGTTYYYRITAYNIAGESVPSDVTAGTPDMLPGSVRDLQAFSGVRNITLRWTEPISNGGSAVIGYKLYRSDNGSEMRLIETLERSTSYIDRGLVDNWTYRYRIAAFNKVGDGNLSQLVYAPTYGEPMLSLNAAIPGDESVTLHWYPLDDGGTPIIRYWVYRGLNDMVQDLYATLTNAITYTDIGVVNGVTYYYRVAAENMVGDGRSQVVSCTPRTVPDAPTELAGRSNDHYVVLSWTAPADDGGSDVLAYNVYVGASSTNLAFLGTVNETQYIASGLEIGVVKYYAVTAVNAAGEGEHSSVLAIASGKTPTYPVNLTFTTGNKFVHLTWEKPWDQGTEDVQKYVIYRTESDGLFSAVAETTSLSYNDTSVTNYVDYRYYVKALNTIGLSDPSNVIEANPHLIGEVPSEPLFFNLTGGDGYILLRWMEPAEDGGQPIASYYVYRGLSEDLLTFYRSTSALEYNATNLPNETTYFFKVTAVNAIGQGNSTEVLNATTHAVAAAEKEEPFLWGILENMFFYAAIVMLACGVGVWFFMIKGKRRGFKKKVQKKAANNKAAQQQQLPKGLNDVLKKK